MRTTPGGWVRRLAFAMSLGGLAALAIAGATSARGASTTDSPPPKVFVCKYVGKPGVDERLQTGDNPINPSASSIPGWDGDPGNLVGLEFADAQGRSVVIAIDVGQDEPDVRPVRLRRRRPRQTCARTSKATRPKSRTAWSRTSRATASRPRRPRQTCARTSTATRPKSRTAWSRTSRATASRPRRPRQTCARTSTATRPPLRPEP